MLTVYMRSDAGLAVATDPKTALETGQFVWADVIAPPGDNPELREAELLVENALKLDVPTPHERSAMEESARFYEEDGAMFLTATLMGQRTEGAFVSDAVTFILKDNRLVTMRTIRPRAFEIGEGRASARIRDAQDGGAVLLALLDGVVERIADLLSETMKDANRLSSDVFVLDDRSNLRSVLRQLGRFGTLVALSHACLSSLNRLSAFAFEVCPRYGLAKERFRAFSRDVQELERQSEAMQSHLNFLMEAALGLTGAAQNNTLKALAAATIAFTPATLIASVFGMNFEHLGWISAPWGPAAAFSMMIAAPAGLFALARWRRWF